MKNDLPPNPYKDGSQKHRIYRRIARYGRVTNREIRYGVGGPEIYNTTGRASEIRDFLAQHGFCLDCVPLGTGPNPSVFEYQVKPF